MSFARFSHLKCIPTAKFGNQKWCVQRQSSNPAKLHLKINSFRPFSTHIFVNNVTKCCIWTVNFHWNKPSFRTLSTQTFDDQRNVFYQRVKSGKATELDYQNMFQEYISRQMTKECLVLFTEMVSSNIQMSPTTFMMLLEHFGNIGQTSSIQNLLSYFKSRKFQPTLQIYNTMIRVAATSTTTSAIELIKEAKQLFPKYPNAIVKMCEDCTEIFATRGHLKALDSLFSTMQESSITPTESIYWNALHAFAKKGDPDFLNYFKRYKDSGLALDQESLQQILVECTHIESAEAVFNTFTTRKESTYIPLLKAYGANGDLSKVNRLLDSIREDGIAISPAMYGTLMCIFRDNKDYDSVFALLNEMGTQDMQPTDDVICAVLTTYGKKGDFESMMEKFDALKNAGGSPYLPAYRSVLQVLCEAQKEKEYLQVFSKMLDEKIPEVADFRLVMQTLSDAPHPNLSALKKIWEESTERMRRPDVFCFNSLLRSLCVCKKWDSVLEYYTANRFLLQPQYLTYKYVLTALCEKKEWDGAISVLMLMKKNEKTISAKTMEPLFTALIREDRADLIEKYWEMYKEWETSPSVLLYHPLMEYYASKNNAKKLQLLIEDMEAQQVMPTAKTVSILLNSTGTVADVVEQFVLRALKQNTDNRNGSAYTAIQSLIQHQNEMNKIVEFLSKAIQANPGKTTDILSVLAKAIDLNDAGQIETLISFFDGNIKKVKTPSVQEYAVIVGTLLAARWMTKAEQIFNEVRSLYEPDLSAEIPSSLYISLGKEYAAKNNKQKLLELIESWKKVKRVPLGHTYGCLLRVCVQQSQFKEVVTYFQELRPLGVKPDEFCYRYYFIALKELPEWTPKQIMEEAVKNNLLENVTPSIANELLDVFVEKGALYIATKFFTKLREGNVNFGTKSCFAFLCALAQEGETESMELVMNYMREFGQIPPSFYNEFIRVYGIHKKDLKKAMEYYHEMRDRKILPDYITFNILINAYAKNGDHKGAFEFLEQKKRRKMKLDSKNYGDVLEAAAAAKDVESLEKWFQDMKANGIQPTMEIYRSMILSYARSGDVNNTVKYLEDSTKKDSSWLNSLRKTATFIFSEKKEGKEETMEKLKAVSVNK